MVYIEIDISSYKLYVSDGRPSIIWNQSITYHKQKVKVINNESILKHVKILNRLSSVLWLSSLTLELVANSVEFKYIYDTGSEQK